MTRPLAEIPLPEPNFLAGDPHDDLAALRRRAPVNWHDAADFWAVTGHDDIQAVSRDTDNSCSGRGVVPSDHSRQIADELQSRRPARVIHGNVEPVPSTLLRRIGRLLVRCRP
ncbi:MAG: hypothetical protein ACYCYQ_05470 [Acidimicrobiales bacterium]